MTDEITPLPRTRSITEDGPHQSGRSTKSFEGVMHPTEGRREVGRGMTKSSPLLFKRLRKKLPPPSNARLQMIFAALMLSMLLLGWNDGSLGPLLPFLQSYYDINYLMISLNWVTNFAGATLSGFTYLYITDRIGFGLAAPLGALIQGVGYAFMSTGGPFALFLIGTGFLGFGFGFVEAQINNMTSRLPNASTKMFIVQACFGLGATVSPFISTPFAQHVNKAYLYFLVSLSVALACVLFMLLSIQGRTEAQCVGHLPSREDEKRSAGERAVLELDEQQGLAESPAPTKVIAEDPRILPGSTRDNHEEHNEMTSGAKMKMMLRTKATWTLMAYNFVYVGIEVGLGGYLTSFLITERGGTAAAGYATSGFWGGITLGRIIMIPVTNRLGYQVSIYVYTSLALALELVIWFTKSLIGNAVCYALVGILLGPIYPAALMVISDILPDEIRGGVMGLTGTAGGAGAAALPFINGAISDKYEIWILQPFTVALLGADLILWAMVPRKRIVAKRQ